MGWMSLLLLVSFLTFAGVSEEQPDGEMLKMMELLREWEMIQNLDFMRQMNSLDRTDEPLRRDGQKSQRPKKEKPK